MKNCTARLTFLAWGLLMPLLTFCFQAKHGDHQQSASCVDRKAMLSAVMKRITSQHYAPKSLNDTFSAAIWKKFLNSLDGNKVIFTRSEIMRLEKYRNDIDDQIQHGTFVFLDSALLMYEQRLPIVQQYCEKLLQSPFDLNTTEHWQVTRTELPAPENESALYNSWHKYLKHQILRRFIELEESVKDNALSTREQERLREKEAREEVRKNMANIFRRLQSAKDTLSRFHNYLNLIALEMDPHSTYAAPLDTRTRNEQLTHRFFGLGMQLMQKEEKVIITKLTNGGTAAKSGQVQVNDQILKVSDTKGSLVPVEGLSIQEVSQMVRGEKGTMVSLLLKTPAGTEKQVSLFRDEILDGEKNVQSAFIRNGEHTIGYIYLPEFYTDLRESTDAHGAAVDVEMALRDLLQQKLDGLIIDLRGNPGGSLQEVVMMAGLFLKPGPVVQLKDKTQTILYNAPFPRPLYNGPLAVMVNNQSASAAEIFAAAMQDYQRGIVIGSAATYGKGTAQQIFQVGKMQSTNGKQIMTSYGSLSLTNQKFYRVSGASTQSVGVIPDIILPDRLARLKIRENNNDCVMPWDTIAAVAFEPMRSVNYEKLRSLHHEWLQKQPTFSVIREGTEWLYSQEEDMVNLQLQQFRRADATRTAMMKKIEAAEKLPEGRKLHLEYPAKQQASPGGASRNDLLSRDIYLEAVVAIIQNMR